MSGHAGGSRSAWRTVIGRLALGVGVLAAQTEAQDARRPPAKSGVDRTAEEILGPAKPGSVLNQTVARVGKLVVTAHDLHNEWKVTRRLQSGLSEKPARGDLLEMKKTIVRDHLWIDQARTFERYADVVSSKQISERARAEHPDLWEEEIAEELRSILERHAEASIAQEALLYTKPEFQRNLEVRPDELRQAYITNRDRFVERAQVLLARVLLGKAVRADALETADQIRSTAQAGGGLESAADQLAKGTFRPLEWEVIEDSGLRPEILAFAQDAEIGAVSAVFEAKSSFSIYELLDRREARTVPFSEAAPRIRSELRRQRFNELARRYFTLKLLPQADFEPIQLFDNELSGR